MNLIDKIFLRCEPIPVTGCWIFMGGLNADGYGVIRDGKRLVYVHHATHDAVKGKPPKGWERDHECGIRCCCNPDHLEAMTPGDNAAKGDWFKYCVVMPAKLEEPPVEGDPFEL